MTRVVALLLAASCVAPMAAATRPATTSVAVTPDAADPAAEVAAQFVKAVKAGQYDVALSLTTARWRQRLTPERFRADFDAEPLAPERLARLERALALGVAHVDARAELRLEGHVELVMTQEGEAWRIDALKH